MRTFAWITGHLEKGRRSLMPSVPAGTQDCILRGVLGIHLDVAVAEVAGHEEGAAVTVLQLQLEADVLVAHRLRRRSAVESGRLAAAEHLDPLQDAGQRSGVPHVT